MKGANVICDVISVSLYMSVSQGLPAGPVVLLPGLQSLSSGAAAELPEQPADTQREVRTHTFTHTSVRTCVDMMHVLAAKLRFSLTLKCSDGYQSVC